MLFSPTGKQPSVHDKVLGAALMMGEKQGDKLVLLSSSKVIVTDDLAALLVKLGEHQQDSSWSIPIVTYGGAAISLPALAYAIVKRQLPNPDNMARRLIQLSRVDRYGFTDGHLDIARFLHAHGGSRLTFEEAVMQFLQSRIHPLPLGEQPPEQEALHRLHHSITHLEALYARLRVLFPVQF